jgi:hypothetical protein
VRPVRWIDQVFDIALQALPAPKSRDSVEADKAATAAEPAAKTGGLENVRAH